MTEFRPRWNGTTSTHRRRRPVAPSRDARSARAAAELRDGAGIRSSTIASLLADLRRGVGLAQGSVLVVDEAGMAGSRPLAELAGHADRSAAKLVLVGDDRQLPEIEAGGAFRSLAERLGA